MKKHLLIALLLPALLMSCSTMKVVVDYDDQVNFRSYKTFHFVTPKKMKAKQKGTPEVIKDPIFMKQARNEIGTVLSEKGFQRAETQKQADFVIAFYATAKHKAQITPPTYHIGRFGRRWVRPGHVHHYKQGTLIVDIVDREKHELVWRGVGSGVLDRNDPRKNLLEAVQKVLAKFPPE